MTKALLIVDMLNDFVEEKGKLPVPGAIGLIHNVQCIKHKAEENNILVVYANDAHAEDDPEFKVWPKHCVKGTYGAEVVEQLKPTADNLTIEKQDLSVFTNSETNDLFRSKGIDELYVVGVATEYCVRGAVLDAIKNGYKTSLITDAIAGVDEIKLPDGTSVPGTKGAVERALNEMIDAGAVRVCTEEALRELK